MKPEPFQIHTEQALLDDLQLRLSHTRYSARLPDAHWKLGTNLDYLKTLVDYWRDGFDWRSQEASLNQFAQFRVDLDGTKLHFVHEASGPPLLLLHGWPDSFYRYYKVIPRLRDFSLVVPSLPGFGFSGAAPRGEQPNRQTAELLFRLMTETLGYQRFAVAGGDGGSVLAQLLAIDHPDVVVGVHLTDLGWQATNIDPGTVSKAEQKYLTASKKHFMADGAYAMVHTTKPNSLAPVLTDSPVALASWIVDRFHSWSDNDGQLDDSFSKDELLTNIMIYWVTQTAASSIWTYRADVLSPSLTPSNFVHRPVALALFPKDMGGSPPRVFAERTLNVQRWTEMPRGGHFPALEVPELYAEDVHYFFSALYKRKPSSPKEASDVRPSVRH